MLVPVVLVVAMAWDRRWMADDGFLHLRVVDQVVEGNGPVFNAGERVETSTSPLWVWLLTLLSFVTGLALPWKAVVAGLVLTAIGMVAAARAAVILGRAHGGAGVVWPVGLAAVAALPPIWDYATSGLETGLAFAWIGGSCWWVAVRATRPAPPSRRAELAGAVLVSVGYTIRPDLALFTIAFGAVLVAACRPSGWRRAAGVAAALAAVPLLNQVFRMGYYALLVPNTALAKEASVAQWGSGLRYLADLVRPYALWVPAAAVAVVLWAEVAADRERRAHLVTAARLAPVAASLAHALYITRVGGDFMHARLLLPAVFGLLAPVGIAPRRCRPGRRSRGLAAAVAVWVVLATVLLRPTYSGETAVFTTGNTIEDERRTWQLLTGMEHPVRHDVRTRRVAAAAGTAPQNGRVVGIAPDDDYEPVEVPMRPDAPATAAGVFLQPAYAWNSGVYMIDTGGLAHPVGGHLDQLSGDRMGHQKFLGLDWQLAEWTAARTVTSDDGRLLVSGESLAAAREAVTCGQLGAYIEGIRSPLTPGRFARNVLESFANTTLRVPADPRDARAELCGG
ncbi:MAG TPA: hypothetical protein VFZ79_06810 [Acidimicrobiales bacterium]